MKKGHIRLRRLNRQNYHVVVVGAAIRRCLCVEKPTSTIEWKTKQFMITKKLTTSSISHSSVQYAGKRIACRRHSRRCTAELLCTEISCQTAACALMKRFKWRFRRADMRVYAGLVPALFRRRRNAFFLIIKKTNTCHISLSPPILHHSPIRRKRLAWSVVSSCAASPLSPPLLSSFKRVSACNKRQTSTICDVTSVRYHG